ncbi:MAG: 7TM-DISM domain-containing protein, partial [Bacteroidota bacterium]
MKRLLLFLLLINLVSLDLIRAQTPLPRDKYVTQLDSDAFRQRYDIRLYDLRFFKDPSGQLDIQAVSEADNRSKFLAYSEMGRPNPEFDSPFEPNVSYWAEVFLNNNMDGDSEWVLFLGYVTHAEVYVISEDGKFVKHPAGMFESNTNLHLAEGSEPKVLLELKAKKIG